MCCDPTPGSRPALVHPAAAERAAGLLKHFELRGTDVGPHGADRARNEAKNRPLLHDFPAGGESIHLEPYSRYKRFPAAISSSTEINAKIA